MTTHQSAHLAVHGEVIVIWSRRLARREKRSLLMQMSDE